MSESALRLLFVGPDRDSYSRLRRALGDLEGRPLRLDWIASLSAAVHLLEHLHPDLCVIDPSIAQDSMLGDLHRLTAASDASPVAVLAGQARAEAGVSTTTQPEGWFWDLTHNRLRLPQSWARDLGVEVRSDGEDPSEIDIDLQPEEWMQRVHPEDLDPLRDDLAALLEGVIGTLDRFHRIRQADGAYRWVHLRLIVHREPDGSPVLVDGSVQRLRGA